MDWGQKKVGFLVGLEPPREEEVRAGPEKRFGASEEEEYSRDPGVPTVMTDKKALA